MSAQKTGFFNSIFYRAIIIFLFLTFVLGGTCCVWQLLSARVNSGVPSAFGYMAVDVNNKDFYTFMRCDVDDLKANDIILYDYANESGVTKLSIGKYIRFEEDGDFGNIVIEDIVHNTTETRSSTKLMGKNTNKDRFSYAMISLFNSNLMLYLFTITPFALIIILGLLRKYSKTHEFITKQNSTSNNQFKRPIMRDDNTK